MLNKKEIEVIELLLENLTRKYTIREISLILRQKYPQTHRLIKILQKKEIIQHKTIGKSKQISLRFYETPEIVQAEIERTKKWTKKNNELRILPTKLHRLQALSCILFGSRTKTQKKSSDIDLLFIIPNSCENNQFENQAKNLLSTYDIDYNIITEENFKVLLNKKKELNIANEILKNHITLTGYDYFISLIGENYD
jgi:predicted nucleotidyltransferase